MESGGKYDPVALIDLIQTRPCIWDKSEEIYKDKSARTEAWKEIYRGLEPDFDKLTPAQQRSKGHAISKRWNNIRDAFMKTLKLEKVQGSRRKYIYHEKLSFLLKIAPVHDIVLDSSMDFGGDVWSRDNSDDDDKKSDGNSVAHFDNDANNSSAELNDEGTSSRKRKREETLESEILKYLNKLDDPDEAFFRSIAPAVKQMSEEAKFEFRIEVMKLVTQIRSRDGQFQRQYS